MVCPCPAMPCGLWRETAAVRLYDTVPFLLHGNKRGIDASLLMRRVCGEGKHYTLPPYESAGAGAGLGAGTCMARRSSLRACLMSEVQEITKELHQYFCFFRLVVY